MIAQTLLLVVLLCAMPAILFSQRFINGSFENATDSCRVDLTNTEASSIVPGLHSFGNSMGPDFRANSCPMPQAPNPPMAREGTKYVIFGSDDIGADSLALELESLLLAGETYTLRYSHRRQSGYTSPAYHIGCSTDSNTFGQFFGIGHCTNFNDEWEDTSYTFTPTQDCKYLTLKSILNGEILYIDDFTIAPAVSSSVADFNTNRNEIKLYPNPCVDNFTIQLDRGLPPFEISVCDITTGQNVFNIDRTTETHYDLSASALTSGTYLFRVIDAEQHVYVSTLVVL